MKLPQHRGKTDWSGMALMTFYGIVVVSGSAWLLWWTA